MHIDVISNYSNFEKLRTNWDALYQIDPEAQFFLSWDWLSQQFTRHQEYWFYILAAKPNPSDSNYVAFFPLRLILRTSKNDLGFYNEITMAGNYWADYNGFICDPDYEKQAIPALAMQLKRMYWAKLNLDYILVSDRRLALFIDQFNNNSL